MAVVLKKLFAPIQLSAIAQNYYTVDSGRKCLIKKLTFTNNDASARTVTVYLVPSGSSVSTTNIITNAQSISASGLYECFEAEGQMLSEGDSIWALSDVASMVTMHASGIEIV